jgi:hypothetical protein
MNSLTIPHFNEYLTLVNTSNRKDFAGPSQHLWPLGSLAIGM